MVGLGRGGRKRGLGEVGDTFPLFWRRGRATSRLQFQGFQPLEASEVVLFIYFLTTPSLTSGKLKGKQHPARLQGVIGLLGGGLPVPTLAGEDEA